MAKASARQRAAALYSDGLMMRGLYVVGTETGLRYGLAVPLEDWEDEVVVEMVMIGPNFSIMNFDPCFLSKTILCYYCG